MIDVSMLIALTAVILIHGAAALFYLIFTRLALAIDVRILKCMAGFFFLGALGFASFSIRPFIPESIGIFITNFLWVYALYAVFCAAYVRKRGYYPRNGLRYVTAFGLAVCLFLALRPVLEHVDLKVRLLIPNGLGILATFLTARYIPLDKDNLLFGEKVAVFSLYVAMLITLVIAVTSVSLDNLQIYMIMVMQLQGLSMFAVALGFITMLLSDLTDNYYRQSISDPMTKLFNRRYFQDQTEAQIATALRHRNPASLLICDIDHFKRVNDGYGHDVGDEAIIRFASILKEGVRDGDILARFGGEEFVCFMPHTDREGAREVAERLRKTTREIRIDTPKGPLSFTASFGVASVTAADDIESMLKRADCALYEAKENGRNRVWLDELPGLTEVSPADA